MANTYNLQLRHGDETKVFATRNDAFNYIDGQIQYGGVSLLPYEPVLFFYGDATKKNTIMIVGLPDGMTNNGKKYFTIDTADLQEKVNAATTSNTTLQTQVDDVKKLIEDETKAREDEDKLINEKVDATIEDLKGVIDACGLVYNNLLPTDKVSYTPDSQDDVIRDAKSLAEAIDKISKFAVKSAKEGQISVKDTPSVKLTSTPDLINGGNIISADVVLSEVGSVTSTENDDNILAIHKDGLYATVNLDYEEHTHTLTFTKSDKNKADKVVKVFELGGHTVYTADNNGHTVKLTVVTNGDNGTISGDVEVSTESDNKLLVKNGKLFVDNGSDSIIVDKNTNETLKTKLNSITTELSATTQTSTSLQTALQSEITRSTQEDADLKTAIDKEVIRAKAVEKKNTDAIEILNGNESTNGSIKKVLKDAKEYADDVATDAKKAAIKASEDITDSIEVVKNSASDLQYILYVNREKRGTIDIPKDQFLKDVTYNKRSKELRLDFVTSSGDKNVIIDIEDLVDTYYAGNGLSINNKTFSVKVDSDSEYLTVSNDGIKVKGIDAAIKKETDRAKDAEDKIADDLANEVRRAKQVETLNADAIATEKSRAEREEKKAADAIDIINGGVTQDGSIKKALKDAKDYADNIGDNTKAYTDTKVLAEQTRAERVETENKNAIASNKTAIEKEVSDRKDAITAVEQQLADISNTASGGLINSTQTQTNLEHEIFRAKTEEASLLKELNNLKTEVDKKANTTDVGHVYATKVELQTLRNDAATKVALNNLSNDVTGNKDAIGKIGINYNEATSELTYTDKDGVQHKYNLYSGSLIKRGEFDRLSNSIILTYSNAGTDYSISIPVSSLLSDIDDKVKLNEQEIQAINTKLLGLAKDWETQQSGTVTLTKNTTGSKDVLTAEVRIASSNKQAIQTSGNGLYVSNDLEDYTVVYGADGTIKAQDAISKLLDTANKVDGVIDNKIKVAINDEVQRVKTITDDIDNKLALKANTVDVYTKEHILNNYETAAATQSKLDAKANTTDVANVYATKAEVSALGQDSISKADVKTITDGLDARITTNSDAIGNIGLTYNPATSTLTYTDKSGTSKDYNLYSGSLIKSGKFDDATNSVVLTIENAGQESNITIPVKDLLSDVSADITKNADEIKDIKDSLAKLSKDWEAKSSGTVTLTKNTTGSKDVLTAEVRIASSNKQAIQTSGDGLYVSNDLEDYTMSYGSEGTISAQTAMNKLLDATTTLSGSLTTASNDLQRLEARVKTNEDNITALTNTVTAHTASINANSNAISDIKDSVKDVKTELSNVKDTVTTHTTKLATIETNVNSLTNRVQTVENTLATQGNQLTTLDNKVTTMAGDITTLTNELNTVKNLMTTLQNTINDFVKISAKANNALTKESDGLYVPSVIDEGTY